jgi:hypothetical protein
MSGTKGHSGRKPTLYNNLNTHEILLYSQSVIRMYLKDESIPLEKRAALAAVLYSKAIKQQHELTVRPLPMLEQAIIDRYTQPTASIIDHVEQGKIEHILDAEVMSGENVIGGGG